MLYGLLGKLTHEKSRRNDRTAILAAVLNPCRSLFLDFLEILAPDTIDLIAFRTKAAVEFAGRDGQVAVAASHSPFFGDDQKQVFVGAGGHVGNTLAHRPLAVKDEKALVMPARSTKKILNAKSEIPHHQKKSKQSRKHENRKARKTSLSFSCL